MKRIIHTLLAALVFCSCASQYSIDGKTSSSDLEGKMVFLKTVSVDGMNSIDSCEIIHGNFSMSGRCDTVCMAELFLDTTPIMPLVLEAVPLQVCINDTVYKVSGTEANDKLYQFLHKKAELEQQLSDLPRQESRMIMDGKDEYEINMTLTNTMQKITSDYDKLVMEYITQNFDNILSVGVFMIHTQGGQAPMITPQIEDIMSKASDKFKNDSYVKAFMQTAEQNHRNIYGK
ncbi:MAG: DUF4369 domain-containing protein [Bacteroidaceae bacterium]|jgi:hypothetical protein|nr:DUF4369 domain-containing protein [Bacteroidaceae bacterium]